MCTGVSAQSQDVEENGPRPDKAASSDRPLSHREQRDHYVWSTFGPPGLITDALASGLLQWRDVPVEWGRGWSGYGKRFASEFAESAVGDTTKYAVARLLDEDPSFYPCECVGTWRRVRHAAVAPFTARKPDGRTVFSMARVAGMTAGNLAQSTWYPGPGGTPPAAFRHVGVDLASKIGVNLLREFIFHRRSLPADFLHDRPHSDRTPTGEIGSGVRP
jgi:hypothetical protein